MKRWERLEEAIHNLPGEGLGAKLGVKEFAAMLGEDTTTASWHVQDYRRAMRAADHADHIEKETGTRPKKAPNPLYCLQRVAGTRTANALWEVGDRAANVRNVTGRLADDWRTNLQRDPTYKRIAASNPRQQKLVDASLELVEAALNVIEAGKE